MILYPSCNKVPYHRHAFSVVGALGLGLHIRYDVCRVSRCAWMYRAHPTSLYMRVRTIFESFSAFPFLLYIAVRYLVESPFREAVLLDVIVLTTIVALPYRNLILRQAQAKYCTLSLLSASHQIHVKHGFSSHHCLLHRRYRTILCTFENIAILVPVTIHTIPGFCQMRHSRTSIPSIRPKPQLHAYHGSYWINSTSHHPNVHTRITYMPRYAQF